MQIFPSFLSFSMTYKFIKLQYMGSNLENFSHNLPLLFFFLISAILNNSKSFHCFIYRKKILDGAIIPTSI